MAKSSAGTASLRQSSRAKKPSRRAEESLEPIVATTPTTTTKTSTTKGQGLTSKSRKGSTRSAASEEKLEEDGGEYQEEDDSGDDDNEDEAVSAENKPTSDVDNEEEEDDEEKEEREGSGDVYCLCKQGDDGRPMVFCAECTDWFHFKCVGLTKKVAEKLSEYICPPCGKRTGKKSKTLDDNDEGEEYAEAAMKEDSDSDTPLPPRRSSAAIKRKSSEDEMPRKRSRSSPQSPITRRPSEPLRKTSGSIAAPTGSTAVMKSRSETLRKHAVEQLAGVFDVIFAEQADVSDEDQEQGRKYAVKFEASLFDLNCETIAKTTIQIAGKAYRDRLRTFLFNLKDKSNTSLRQKITSNNVTADALAAMDNDALANDDIRKEVERRKKENLEQSILKKEVAPLRKLTHKGEIDIDYEAVHQSRINAERESEKEIKAIREDETATASELKAEATVISPVKAAPFGSPTVSVPTRRMTSSAQSPPMAFDFGTVWTGEEAKEEEDEGIAQVEDAVAEGEVNKDESEIQIEEHADNFIDDFLGMPEEKVESQSAPSAAAQDTSNAVKWRGLISMPEEGICTGRVRQVAGRALNDDEWKNLFPSSHSIIEGRLPTDSGAPYLVQSKMAPRTELVVMTFEASWEPEAIEQLAEGFVAPSNDDDNSRSFEKLLSYFHRRDRYGVLPPLASAKGVLVKDFYITPLPKIGMIPQWMEMMQASEFQGQASHSRDIDMFLLVAVLFKQRPPSDAALSPPQGTSNLSSMLGSNTLQDLLKAVGGSNRSPATPLAAGYQSPASQANTLDQAIMQHQPSIETLREMPKVQLEEMMYRNPNLVDQLLKTLNATKAPSPGPLARPPGPPPPPPPSMQRPPYQMPPNNGYNSYGHQSPQQYPSPYDYNYQSAPQSNQRPYPAHHQGAYPAPAAQQQGWRPQNNGYPSGPYNQSSPPLSHNGAPNYPPSGYGPRPPYNPGGAPPQGQRRY